MLLVFLDQAVSEPCSVARWQPACLLCGAPAFLVAPSGESCAEGSPLLLKDINLLAGTSETLAQGWYCYPCPAHKRSIFLIPDRSSTWDSQPTPGGGELGNNMANSSYRFSH